jgi:hypothetical protein
MKYFPLLLFLLTFSCEDDDDPRLVEPLADLMVDFVAEYDDRPLAIQSESYAYPTGAELKVLLFQYYISDLELLPADGSDPVLLNEIDLLKWEGAGAGAMQTETYRVPRGAYRGLRFGLGVKPSLNAIDPNNFAADYILNETEFWNATARYVFAKIEANADLENDGTYDTGLSYHMGADPLYTVLTFERDFTVGTGSETRLSVVADVLAALSGNGNTFDIADPAKQAVHGGNQAVAQDIWERLAGGFVLEITE